MDKGVGGAFFSLAGDYSRGISGLTKDDSKAIELLLRAGQLGYSEAYYNLGSSYLSGHGIEVDMKKAKHFYELSAMGGYVPARHYLGALEGMAGNDHRAMKHYMIGARAGYKLCLDSVKIGFTNGVVTKDDYASTLRAYQKSIDDMKSGPRDTAEALQTMRTGMFE